MHIFQNNFTEFPIQRLGTLSLPFPHKALSALSRKELRECLNPSVDKAYEDFYFIGIIAKWAWPWIQWNIATIAGF